MIEIHVVNHINSTLYRDEIVAYQRLRHDVFIEEQGWKGLTHEEGHEKDQYDNENAVYILAISAGEVVGGQRLYPTTIPHMLSEVFAHLSQWPIPKSDDTWECTRYFVRPDKRSGRTDIRLMLAMQQYCIEEGIAHLTGVISLATLPRWLQAGYKLRPLGLPYEIEGQPTIAVISDITSLGFDVLRSRLGIKPQPLYRRGIDADVRRAN